ncbi:MAG: hypothetical protein IJA31_11095 [Clostridia bacterium]|nr:hypothetical protein [Clostridia bacterium]
MNDFNQFLNLLRERQTETEKKAEPKKQETVVAVNDRRNVVMRGELARPIGADVSEFLESIPAPEEAPAQPVVEETKEEAVGVLPQEDVQEEQQENAQEAVQEDVQADEMEDEDIKNAVIPEIPAEPPVQTAVAKQAPATDKTRKVITEELSLFDLQINPDGGVAPVALPEKTKIADGGVAVEKTKHIANKGSLLRAIAKTARESDQADGQIVMEGFDANDPVQTDEQAMEEELRTVREKRIEEFGLPKNPEETVLPEHSEPPKTKTLPLPAFLAKTAEKFADRETPFVDVETDEYNIPEDRRRVSIALRDAMRKTGVKAGIHAGLGLILLVVNLITTASANDNNGFFTVFGASINAYAIFNLLFFIPSAVLLLPDFKNAIITVLKLRARTEAALLGMYLAVFAQNIALFFTELRPEHDYHLFTGACVLLGALYTASKIFWIKNTRYCFKQAGVTETKLYLRSVRDPQALRTLLCENNVDGVCVDLSLKTRFVSDFLKRSSDAARSAMPRSVLTPVLGVLCVLCGIIAAAVQGSPVCGISAVAGAACLSFPVCGVVIGSLLLCDTNRILSDKKACVGSLRDARNVVTADHLAFGGKDLFRVKLVNTATVDGVSEKAAAVTAAMLAKKAGDTMAAAFLPVLADYNGRQPVVEEFAVEEKLGVSAWVDNCRVLLGSAQMLVNHNIQPGKLPNPQAGEQYLFLAIEGNAVAVFTILYTCRENLSQSLNAVSKTGVNLLVRTTDPNLTAEMIQHAAALPENSVRIVPKAGGELFDRLYENVSDRESAGIIGAAGFSSLCNGIGEAVRLDRSGKTVAYVCTASAVVGVCAALLLCITGSIGKASGWSAVILQIIWNVAAFLLPQVLYKLSVLKNEGLQKVRAKKAQPQVHAEPEAEPETVAPVQQASEQPDEQLHFVLSNGFAMKNEE